MGRKNTSKLQEKTESSKKTAEALRSGARLRAARNALHHSRDVIAELTGGKISASRLGNYEQGLRELGIAEAEILAPVLHEPAAYLMGLIDEKQRDLLKLPKEAREALMTLHGAMSSNTGMERPQKPPRKPEGRPIDTPVLPASLQRR